MKIKTKILITGCFIAFIPLLMGFIVFRNIANILENKIINDVGSVSVLKEKSLEVYLEETESIGNFFENSDIVKEYVSYIGKELDKSEEALFEELALEVNDILYTFQESNWGKYHHMFLIDDSKRIVLSPNHGKKVEGSPSSHFGEDVSSNEWVESSFKEGKIKVSDYTSWIESDHLHQMMFFPLKNFDGDTKAVIGFEMQIPYELSILADISSENSLEKVSLTSSDGYPITYEKSVNRIKTKSLGINKALEKGSFVGSLKDEQGSEFIGSYRKHDIYPWVLSVEIDKKDAFKDVKRVEYIVLAGFSFLAVTIVLVTYLLIREPLKQIDELTDVAKNLSKGNLHVRSKIKSQDELGVFSETFNKMANSILESQVILEEKIEDKTRDLAKFRLAVEGASDHIIITDPSGSVLYANPASSKMTGYSNSEVINSKPSLWGARMSKSFYEKMWSVISKDKKPFKGVLENKRKNGQIYSAEINITPILNNQEKVIYYIGIERDITDEKRLKEVLKKQKELKDQQSNTMLSSIAEGVVITDSEAKVTYVNNAFTKITGFDLTDLKGKEFASSIKVFDLKEVPLPPMEASDASVITKRKKEGKILLQVKKGEKRAVNISASAIKLGNEFNGVIRIIHDFNEDYELQKQRDDFFAITSHELRTPLTVISGNIDMILDGKDSNKIPKSNLEMLSDTREASDRLIKLVHDFLNVSRLDQGRIGITTELLSFCDVVSDVIKELSPLAKSKSLKLINKCKETKLEVMADKNLLQEVLKNLIGNSIKFTDKGSITVEHKVQEKMIVTTITDTGIGISKENRKKLFKRYQQAMERTLSRKAGGTGLGLYISRQFIDLMGGSLNLVKSELNKGSIFEMKIPMTVKGEEPEDTKKG